MRYEPTWRLVIDGERAIASRSLGAVVAPYLPMLAATIIWDPLLGLVLGHVDRSASLGTMGIVFCVPIIAMVYWVPRLAAERRRIVLTRTDAEILIDKIRFDRSQLLEVVLLPHRRLTTRHRILVTFAAGDFVNLVEIASERHVEAARGLGTALAGWLGVPLTAAASAPPTAIVRRTR